MKVIINKVLPFKGFAAVNIFGLFFFREEYAYLAKNTSILKHEAIHTKQMQELGYIFFYIIYFLEWLVNLFRNFFNPTAAYRMISFEREAYAHQSEAGYLNKRKHFAQWR